ncbi:MAG: hypothetical protein RsTaC01_0937 [Candidatus Paraimprobicoccus trichonymphae]|uniref:Uncharacterized protein n=1 Tax=Candidatus Paraimprobicoccus trichonymphae TaxID=3033793 RepID=A0AA48KY24_9FIRM|nr:MAG: hypothetical protein RsTaC01_0937 [Candidatus Paraimprobicoccus trichonymphae]
MAGTWENIEKSITGYEIRIKSDPKKGKSNMHREYIAIISGNAKLNVLKFIKNFKIVNRTLRSSLKNYGKAGFDDGKLDGAAITDVGFEVLKKDFNDLKKNC